MNDRPNAAELIAAARLYLEGDLIPSLTDARQRFQTLVAANVLAVAERELLTEETQLLAEWQTLNPGEPAPARLAQLRAGVLGLNERLCEAVRRGEYDEPDRFRVLLRQLRAATVSKLEVANPRYLAAAGKGA